MLALDLSFRTSRRQPPGLWTLPKHYLDLLGDTSAPSEDPGPVLYRDDRQVKMLFVSCHHGWGPDRTAAGTIFLEARTRASALADMHLAGELVDRDDELWGDDMGARDFDPWLDIDTEDDRWLPPNPVPWFRFHDLTGYQGWLLASNDRRLRAVFFGAGHWLLTGTDPDARAIRRLGALGASIKDLQDRHAKTNEGYRQLLRSGMRIELPPLPMRSGVGASFTQGVRVACRDFLARYPALTPLVVPLRVTVLVVPPKRAGRSKRTASNEKDLDNILMAVLNVVEEELKPHAEPWSLAPRIEGSGVDPSRWEEALARVRTISSSNTWAYQVLELHRRSEEPDEGSLILVPGLGWNGESLWHEAEQIVERCILKSSER